ncbi:MAG: hypothetical protein WKF96_19180 [Solirubrobacteraceae bacterium]
MEEVSQAAGRARSLLAGRVVWSVSSTAGGGGVAEINGEPLVTHSDFERGVVEVAPRSSLSQRG